MILNAVAIYCDDEAVNRAASAGPNADRQWPGPNVEYDASRKGMAAQSGRPRTGGRAALQGRLPEPYPGGFSLRSEPCLGGAPVALVAERAMSHASASK